MKITVETTVATTPDTAWKVWTSPNDIVRWNFALDSWHCPSAKLDLKENGRFCYRMEAKDGSMGFDFEGIFTRVIPRELLAFDMGDGREVTVEFIPVTDGVKVQETFVADDQHSAEQQRQGWQSILDNFKQVAEQY